jgi:DEAD/DEAH box helicase domain-containing protein
LLASELLGNLKTDDVDAKLVSFADSRQDAANAALDVERRHHEDIRRELLVSGLMDHATRRPGKEALERRKQEILAEVRADPIRAADLGSELKNIGAQMQSLDDDSMAISEVIDLRVNADDIVLKPGLARMVELGIHPTDPNGISPIAIGNDRNPSAEFAWEQLFVVKATGVEWANDVEWADDLSSARTQVVSSMRSLVNQTVFHRAYFSLEESGFGYACLPCKNDELPTNSYMNALLRVLADQYRYVPSEWTRTRPLPWTFSDR